MSSMVGFQLSSDGCVTQNHLTHRTNHLAPRASHPPGQWPMAVSSDSDVHHFWGMSFQDTSRYGFVWKCWVYSQWNIGCIPNEIAIFHIGIMISKTIGYNGVHDIFRHTHISMYFKTLQYMLYLVGDCCWLLLPFANDVALCVASIFEIHHLWWVRTSFFCGPRLRNFVENLVWTWSGTWKININTLQ